MSANEAKFDKIVVTFNNNFNRITVKDLTETESSLFFALISKAKNKGTEEVFMCHSELLEISGLAGMRLKRFAAVIDSLWKKIKETDCTNYLRIENSSEVVPAGGATLFSHLTIDTNTHYVRFGINPYLTYLFNDFDGGYTSFPLKEISRIKGTKGQLLFKALSQFSSTGWARFTVRDLKIRLGCSPDIETNQFNNKVLRRAINSVQESFPDLTLAKEKRGREITGYLFEFTRKRPTREWDPGFKKKRAKEQLNREMESLANEPTSSKGGASMSISEFFTLLNKIDIMNSINEDYFERNRAALDKIKGLYRVKVVNDPDNRLWNDMTFLASLIYLVRNDLPPMTWALNKAHLEVSKAKSFAVDDEIYETLSDSNAEKLYNFIHG